MEQRYERMLTFDHFTQHKYQCLLLATVATTTKSTEISMSLQRLKPLLQLVFVLSKLYVAQSGFSVVGESVIEHLKEANAPETVVLDLPGDRLVDEDEVHHIFIGREELSNLLSDLFE